MPGHESKSGIHISKLKSLNKIMITYTPPGPTRPLIESLFDPVGLQAKTPQKAAGILADPPESEPTPKAQAFDATNAPYPPDEPPLIKAGLCGFSAVPKSVFED